MATQLIPSKSFIPFNTLRVSDSFSPIYAGPAGGISGISFVNGYFYVILSSGMIYKYDTTFTQQWSVQLQSTGIFGNNTSAQVLSDGAGNLFVAYVNSASPYNVWVEKRSESNGSQVKTALTIAAAVSPYRTMMVFNSNTQRLYVVAGNSFLYEVNNLTWTTTSYFVNFSGGSYISGITFNSNNGYLYAISKGANGSDSIGYANISSALAGNLGFTAFGQTYVNGSLYGIAVDPISGNVFTTTSTNGSYYQFLVYSPTLVALWSNSAMTTDSYAFPCAIYVYNGALYGLSAYGTGSYYSMILEVWELGTFQRILECQSSFGLANVNTLNGVNTGFIDSSGNFWYCDTTNNKHVKRTVTLTTK